MLEAIPPLPNTPSWRGAQLKKHRDYFLGTRGGSTVRGNETLGSIIGGDFLD